VTASPQYPQLRLGTAPDSWGVWFPDDPRQVHWSTYLDEAAAAGYRWTELGPYGYLPTDPARLGEELDRRGLALTGGAVFVALHRGPAALEQAKRDCALEAATLVPLGARHLVILPEGSTDPDGNVIQSPDLTADQWRDLTTGMDELGRYVGGEHGLELVFHSHADSHVATQDQIVRFLDATDPRYVNLCLDTGHVAYCGGDNLALIRDYPDRVRYVHLKQVDPAIRRRVVDERLGFAPAVRLGAMVEPPTGEPDMPPLLAALGALGRELFCIVEQDMYPCDPDRPLPIARRTGEYFAGCGLGAGRVPAAGSRGGTSR
jgi:inosose dehydratase